MKLSFEVKRNQVESWELVHERRYETEQSWDASGRDFVEAFAGFMLAGGFAKETIAECFRDWAEDAEDDSGVWDDSEEFDEDEWDESEEAKADEKTAPVQDGEGGF